MKLQQMEDLKKSIHDDIVHFANRKNIDMKNKSAVSVFMNEILDVLVLADCFGFETNEDQKDAEIIDVFRKYPARVSILICEEMQ